MKIKVCGMREASQIEAIYDVDYLGFIFYDKSPRHVTGLIENSQKAERVGVFVNESLETVLSLAKKNNLTAIQLHGNESPDYCKQVRNHLPVIKAFGIKEGFNFSNLNDYEQSVSFFLFDTYTPQHGGSGRVFNWDILNEYQGEIKFFLSGGINPESVEAITSFIHPKFYGIDINSGFEISPANKDINAIKAFIHAIRK